jgi:hypothetical protein
MASKKTPETQSKSDFIREQPKDMSVADVIAKGKEAGIKFTSSLVYMVRGRQDGKTSTNKAVAKRTGSKRTGAKKTSSKKTPPKKLSTASKKASPKISTKPGESKADFVRKNPTLSANEIAAKAKAEGVILDANYVYSVRGQDKAAAKRKRAAKKLAKTSTSVTPTATSTKTSKPTTPKPASNGTGASGSSSSVEDLLKAAASELGLARAIDILQGERARVRAVLGGVGRTTDLQP